MRVDGGLGRVCKTVACVFYPPPITLGLIAAGEGRREEQTAPPASKKS
jgi:hypothetical protein